MEAQGNGGGSIEAAQEGTTSTIVVRETSASSAVAVADRTQQQGHTRPPEPARALIWPTKPPPQHCSKPALAPPPPRFPMPCLHL